MKNFFLKLLTLISYITMVSVNFLAVSLPLAGRSTGAISDSYPNLFAPSGYAFSIWGVIYLLLAIFSGYQLFFKKDESVNRLRKLFVVNGLLNSAWIFAWHYDFIGLSVLIMLGLLANLIMSLLLFEGKKLGRDYVFFKLPFEVYLGWITVATIANVTVFLVSVNWNGFGLSETFWTTFILIVGLVIGLRTAFYFNSAPYALVLLWAYGGILHKHTSEKAFSWQYPEIVITVTLSIFIFIISSLYLSFCGIRSNAFKNCLSNLVKKPK